MSKPQRPMNFSGNRTYLTVLIAALYLAGAKLGYWPADEQVVAGLGFLAVAFLRAGISATKPTTPPNP
jgi:hypothetical protein